MIVNDQSHSHAVITFSDVQNRLWPILLIITMAMQWWPSDPKGFPS